MRTLLLSVFFLGGTAAVSAPAYCAGFTCTIGANNPDAPGDILLAAYPSATDDPAVFERPNNHTSTEALPTCGADD